MEYPVIAKSIGINWRLLYEISRSNTYINRPSPQKQEYNCKILQDEHYRFDFAQNVFTGSFRKFYNYTTQHIQEVCLSECNGEWRRRPTMYSFSNMNEIRLGRSAPPFPIPEFSSRFIVQKYIECREREIRKAKAQFFFSANFLMFIFIEGNLYI